MNLKAELKNFEKLVLCELNRLESESQKDSSNLLSTQTNGKSSFANVDKNKSEDISIKPQNGNQDSMITRDQLLN